MKDDMAMTISKTYAASHEDLPVYSAAQPPIGMYGSFGKRAFDILLIVAALPFVLPLMAVLTAIIYVFEGSPFYSQPRIGLNGHAFRMWKFRSMVRDADRKLETCLAADPAMRAEWDLHQKLKHDPRITRLGRILRKTSLDELPQLWNVLIGDMSLVGPRPMMVDQHSLYPGTAYFRMRPGLTGPWQVSDRNDISFSSRAGFDADYEQKLSFGHDLGLIFKTAIVVLKATGR